MERPAAGHGHKADRKPASLYGHARLDWPDLTALTSNHMYLLPGAVKRGRVSAQRLDVTAPDTVTGNITGVQAKKDLDYHALEVL